MISLDLEREYNNRGKMPDSPEIIARWARDAAAFRAARRGSLEADLAYGPTPRQKLDMFWPGDNRGVPVAMFIHGGYWQALDKSWVSHLASGLLAHDIAVCMPSYDLCPEVSLAAIVEQLRLAAAFVLRRHGWPLFVTGHSAGGHLAAMLAVTDWSARGLPARSISGCYALSGLFDLQPLVSTSVNIKLGLDAAEAARLSPVLLARPACRVDAAVGALEGVEYERQSRAIAQAWGGEWHVLENHNHFTVIDPLRDPGSDMVALLRRRILAGD